MISVGLPWTSSRHRANMRSMRCFPFWHSMPCGIGQNTLKLKVLQSSGLRQPILLSGKPEKAVPSNKRGLSTAVQSHGKPMPRTRAFRSGKHPESSGPRGLLQSMLEFRGSEQSCDICDVRYQCCSSRGKRSLLQMASPRASLLQRSIAHDEMSLRMR